LAFADTIAIAWRNLKGMQRVPEVVVFSTVQPVIFVLMFRYVFGGAIRIPGVRYVDFLMPGIFVQTVTFGAVNTAVALGEDLHKGLIERFRSLPMARSAVLAGRSVADLTRNLFVVLLMVIVGTAVGFRIHTNALAFMAGIGLLLAFAFAMSWIFALVGLASSSAEAAQAASFPVMAVLVFASSAFVPVKSMPGWLQVFADHQPVSVTVDAIRALVLGGPTAGKALAALAWAVGIVAVFAPLAVARYRRTS
jgi:ABC-2 type transport system permease protein/oleandomycin transport system permease protein